MRNKVPSGRVCGLFFGFNNGDSDDEYQAYDSTEDASTFKSMLVHFNQVIELQSYFLYVLTLGC